MEPQNTDKREKAYENIVRFKENSENDYEKNLMYITAGTLVLSITFLEKITPIEDAIYLPIIVVSWSALCLSIGLNLFSHWLTNRHAENLEKSFINENINLSEVNSRIDKNNIIMAWINGTTLTALLIGIICLVLYCSINILTMSKKVNNSIPTPAKPSEIIEKGRSMSRVFTPTEQSNQPQQTQSDSSSNQSNSSNSK